MRLNQKWKRKKKLEVPPAVTTSSNFSSVFSRLLTPVLKIIIHNDIHAKGRPRAVVKLLPCDHKVIGSSENNLL
jgi:hypothetical protein